MMAYFVSASKYVERTAVPLYWNTDETGDPPSVVWWFGVQTNTSPG
jgi:hypothetical protein